MKLSADPSPSFRWGRWIIASFVFAIGWTLFQLVGPNPRIIISNETTVITSPLRDNGLPDYKGYWRDLGREGVTPENNGAVLLWQAMWPGELEQKDWQPMCDALGMEDIPTAENDSLDPFAEDLKREIGLWLVQQLKPDFTPQNSTLTTQQLDRVYYRVGAERIIESAMGRPWTSEEIPILAAWLTKHKEQYELLVAASKRPKFWSPSPSVLDSIDENTGFMEMPMYWTRNNAFYALFIRAMWNLGEERPDDAWCDLQACFRLSNLISQGNSVYEEVGVMNMQSRIIYSTITLLHHGNPSSGVARQILRTVCELQPLRKIALAVDRETRIYFADSALGLARGRDKLADLSGGQIFTYFEPSEHLRFDWNYVLRQGTYWHDKLTKSASRPTRQERLAAFEKYNDEVGKLEESFLSG